MRPILFELFGWGVPSWHFFFVLAAFIGYFGAYFSARWALSRGSRDAELFLQSLSSIFVICYVSGWFGARILSIFVEQFDVNTPLQFVKELFSIGPMTFYGGALLAVACGSLFVWHRKVQLKFAMDCGVLGGVFALGVGRIGCFLNGDDYGAPVASQMEPPWWAVKFDVLQDGGVYRYPVQIEETLASFVIGLFGFALFSKFYSSAVKSPRRQRSGNTAAWVGLLSAGNRIFNEAFRGDPRGFFFGTQISTSSGISLLIVGFCAYCLFRLRRSATSPD